MPLRWNLDIDRDLNRLTTTQWFALVSPLVPMAWKLCLTSSIFSPNYFLILSNSHNVLCRQPILPIGWFISKSRSIAFDSWSERRFALAVQSILCVSDILIFQGYRVDHRCRLGWERQDYPTGWPMERGKSPNSFRDFIPQKVECQDSPVANLHSKGMIPSIFRLARIGIGW